MDTTTTIFTILVLQARASFGICRSNQLAVIYSPDSNIKCIDCPFCPPGFGAAVQCGSTIPFNTSIDCVPCIQGEFSNSSSLETCNPCSKCKPSEVLDVMCTSISDTRCSCKACPKGYYRNQTTSQCLPCSLCCDSDAVVKQCTNQGMPPSQTCRYQKRNQCMSKYKCWYDEVTVLVRGGDRRCLPCPVCSDGYGLTAPCGSTVNEGTPVTCQRPMLGETFVNQQVVLQQCRVCPRGRVVQTSCSLSSDTICGPCSEGFYFNDLSQSCEDCFSCCNLIDKDDIGSCVRVVTSSAKGNAFFPFWMLSNTLLAGVIPTSQKYASAQQAKDKFFLKPWEKAIFGLALIAVICAFCHYIYLVFKPKSSPEKECPIKSCFVEHPEEFTHKKEGSTGTQLHMSSANSKIKQEIVSSDADPNETDLDLDQPELVRPGIALFRRTGVEVHSCDVEKLFFNSCSQAVSLRACHGLSLLNLLDDGELLLSPVITFQPRTKFKRPVHVQIPHAANIILSPKGWFIVVKTLHNGQWFDVSHQQASDLLTDHNISTVRANHVEFETSQLATFAILGRYDDSAVATVLKRMKAAAFCSGTKVGQALHVRIYCFDDCEWAYERLVKEEEKKGGKLISSLESFDFSVNGAKDVEITVKRDNGWKLDPASLFSKTFSSKSLKESFSMLSTPCCDLVFYPTSDAENTFFATIALTQSAKETMIFAGTPVKEDLRIPAPETPSLQKKENVYYVLPQPEAPKMTEEFQQAESLKVFSLSEKTLNDIALTLDMLPKGVGNWRHVARKLGVSQEHIEVLGREYLDPDGSPTTVLLKHIKLLNQNLSVKDFIEILLDIKREDAVKCIISELENANQLFKNKCVVQVM